MIDRKPEYITEEEQKAIVKWINENINDKRVFSNAKALIGGKWNPNYPQRVNTYKYDEFRRGKQKNRGNVVDAEMVKWYPKEILDILRRMQEEFGGIIEFTITAAYPGGMTFRHKDSFSITRNILLQKPEIGGNLILADEEIELNERELISYCPIKEHEVIKSRGAKKRYILIVRTIR